MGILPAEERNGSPKFSSIVGTAQIPGAASRCLGACEGCLPCWQLSDLRDRCRAPTSALLLPALGVHMAALMELHLRLSLACFQASSWRF